MDRDFVNAINDIYWAHRTNDDDLYEKGKKAALIAAVKKRESLSKKEKELFDLGVDSIREDRFIKFSIENPTWSVDLRNIVNPTIARYLKAVTFEARKVA